MAVLSCADDPRKESYQWIDADKLFRGSSKWAGADSAYSVPLKDDRILWLFGDTFTSQDRSTMVHNSVGIQQGKDPSSSSIEFYQNFFPGDKDSGTYFWPGAGIFYENSLAVFRTHVISTEGEGLGFDVIDWSLVLFENTSGHPATWKRKIVPSSIPFKGMMLGTALAMDKDHVFSLAYKHPYGYVLRWKIQDFFRGNIENAEWWDSIIGWVSQRDLRELPSPIEAAAGPEASLHYEAAKRKWMIVRSMGFGDSRIGAWYADTVEGPWSNPEIIFNPSEGKIDGVLVYSAKSHPEISSKDFLAVTYSTNTLDFTRLVKDSSLYYPRFIRIAR